MIRLKKLLAVVLAVVMLMSTLPMVSVGALSIYPELTLETPVDLTVGESGKIYTFTPEKDGWYKFYSLGEADTFITINRYLTQIGEGDDHGEDMNFTILIELEADQKYYLNIGSHIADDEAVGFQVVVEEAVSVESMNITQYPYNTTVYEGFEFETADLSGLEIEFTMSDGETVFWTYEEDGMVGDYYVDAHFEGDEEGNYSAIIICGGVTESIKYTVLENPVESISVESGSQITLYKDVDGYLDEELGWFIYTYEVPQDVNIEISYKDGTSEVANFYDVVNGMEFRYNDSQYESAWQLGENEVVIEYFGATTSISATVVENPIKNIVVSTNPSAEYAIGDENYGYYSDDIYFLSPDDLSGIELTVEYKDGTTEVLNDEDIDMDNMIINGRDYVVPHVPVYEVGTQTAYLIYMGFEVTFDVEVVDGVDTGVLGDVDGDGSVTIIDATAVQRYVAQLETLEDDAFLAGDVDVDGDVSIMDATLIQRLVAQIIDEF